MTKPILMLLCICTCFMANAQIRRVITTPSAIAGQIPGYSQVSTIATKTYSYAPSTPTTPPTPVDEDSTTEDIKTYKYADNMTVSISMADGNITSTTAGKVWTLRITVTNALNVGFVFNQFSLSSSALLFVFNEARTILDSAIKLSNFSSSSQVGIFPIKGSSVIIYIVEPGNSGALQSVVAINKVEAGFMPIDDGTGSGGGGPVARTEGIDCDPTLLCDPSKMSSARSVARIATNGHQCTCTLLNSENNNGRALVLTAFHCLDVGGGIFGWSNGVIDASEQAALANARFQFQFWRTACNGPTNNTGITFTGAVLRAANNNSDFVLLEMLNPPGVGDGVNYAGWNRSTSTPADFGNYILHHPEGNDMRVTTTKKVNTWFWNNSFWTVHYNSGTVARGSSGSSLMNQYGQVVGQLRSGWSSCTFTNFGDRYGKFSTSWGGGLGNIISPTQNLSVMTSLILSPLTINGNDFSGCPGPNVVFSVPNLLGCTFIWTTSANLGIVSGQNTSAITVHNNSPNAIDAGWVQVTITDTKGFRRVLTVRRDVQIRAVISISMTSMGCSGQYQQWNLSCTPVSNGSNWHWTVDHLGTNSQITIYSPSSPSTIVSVKGGGTVRLNYTDACGAPRQDGVTVYSTCFGPPFRVTVSPNPVSSTLHIGFVAMDKSKPNGVEMSTTPVRYVESTGKTIMSLYELNTGNLAKQWTYHESKSLAYRINISDLKKGIYVLQLDRDNQTRVTKIVVQ